MKNMKNLLMLFFIGAIFMLDNGCSGGIKYAKYESKNPQLKIAIDYPDGWIHDERMDARKQLVSVIFVEKSRNKKSRAYFIVSKKQAQDESLDAFLVKNVNLKMKLDSAKVDSKLKTKLFGVDAWDVVMSYKLPDNIYSPHAKSMHFKERMILFQKDGCFYMLRYENTLEDFSRLDHVFLRCVKTLKFLK